MTEIINNSTDRIASILGNIKNGANNIANFEITSTNVRASQKLWLMIYKIKRPEFEIPTVLKRDGSPSRTRTCDK